MNREELTKNIDWLSSRAADLNTAWNTGNMYEIKSAVLDMKVILDMVQRQVKDDLYANLRQENTK